MGKDGAVQAPGVQYLPPNLGRDRLHEQTVVPKPKDIPVKAVPITEIPFKAVPMNIPEESMPYRQTISAKASPEAPVCIPIE